MWGTEDFSFQKNRIETMLPWYVFKNPDIFPVFLCWAIIVDLYVDVAAVTALF